MKVVCLTLGSTVYSIGTFLSTGNILFPYELRSFKNCEESAWTQHLVCYLNVPLLII